MPVLGSGGRILLKRPAPQPCELKYEEFRPDCNSFIFNCPGWWNGDLVCVDSLPISIGGFPSFVEGYASYQESKYFVGPNRDHIFNDNDAFYKNAANECYPDGQCQDAANFYCKNGVGDVPGDDETGGGCYYINIDAFGYVRFYEDKCHAIAGCGSPLDLENVYFDEPIQIYPYGESDYQNARWDCDYDSCYFASGDYEGSDVQDQTTDISICESAPEFDFPVAGTAEYGDADVLPRPYKQWPNPQALCGIREYSLTLDAPSIDTTIVGEKFGEAVKSLVSGGGSFEFFIDRNCFGDDTEDASWMMMNLLFNTEGGCSGAPIETEAWFTVIQGNGCNDCFPPIGGSLYYRANILITQTAVNVRPTELVVGTANFITTGPIKLMQGPA
jgi:hypothetical protein